MSSQKYYFHNKKNKENIFSNVEKIIDYVYSENFSRILIEEKTTFINNIETQVLDFLKCQYKENEYIYQRELSLYKRNKDNIINRYESDYIILHLEYEKYKKYPNKVPYLVRYRKHCFNSEQNITHKCSVNKFGKFIEVFHRNNYVRNKTKINLSSRMNNENNASSYVICTECSTCYMSSLIKAYCPSCKYEYITSKLEENEKENLFPATWKEYHCQPIIVNEIMKCIKCENILYVNLLTKKLVCLNKKCNFASNPQSILWKCKICKKDFRSSAKVFSPLESKILQNEVWKSLLYKQPALPKKIFCCKEAKEKYNNIIYYHDEKCKGELYKGYLDGREIVICNLCHAVNFNEKFIWTCPICKLRFNYHGKKHRNENDGGGNKNMSFNNNNNFYNSNSKLKQKIDSLKYISEKKQFSEKCLKNNKNENEKENENRQSEKILLMNNRNKRQPRKHNYSTNIKVVIGDNDNRNNTNNNKNSKKLFYGNDYTIPSIEIKNCNNTIDFNKNIIKEIEILKKPICISNKNIPKPKYSKKKKKVRYQTLLDILEEREKYKINNKSRDESINNDNITNENNKLKEYYCKKRLKLLEQSKPQTSMKKDKSKKTLFYKFFDPQQEKPNNLINNFVDTNSLNKKKKSRNNLINISDSEEKKYSQNIEINPKEYQYESIKKNLQKKLSDNINMYSSKIIATSPESKDKLRKSSNFKDKIYSKRYKDDQSSATNEENDIEINENNENNINEKSQSKKKSKNKNISKNHSYKYKINIDKKKSYLKESNYTNNINNINSNNNNNQNIMARKISENNINNNKLYCDMNNNDIYIPKYYKTNTNNFNDNENKENKENNDNNKNQNNNINEIKINEENEIANVETKKNKVHELKINIKVYKSSRLKRNQIFKKIFLNKIKNKTNLREKERIALSNKKNYDFEKKSDNNDNNNYNDNNDELVENNNINVNDNLGLKISPLGDIGQDIISKDDFIKIANECIIPTFNDNNIKYLNPIGHGSYGVIYAVEEINTKKQFALKSVLCQNLNQILKHKKEFELCYSLNHENIIKINNVLFKYLDMTTYLLYVLMEKAETDWGTEIEKRIKNQNFYTEIELINIMKQLVNVLCYLQRKNISHRDIKPQNILICKNNIFKITDLGEAKTNNNSDINKVSTLKGSQLFMSPNLFFVLKYEGNKTKVRHNIFKSDVFSLGYCFVYAMSLDLKLIKCLREETAMVDVLSVITRFGIDKKYSEKFMNIIYKMIQTDENKRCDFFELNDELNKIN